jgi:hypothetical protein
MAEGGKEQPKNIAAADNKGSSFSLSAAAAQQSSMQMT